MNTHPAPAVNPIRAVYIPPYPVTLMTQPFLPPLRALLAPMGRRSLPRCRSIAQLTLSQLERCFSKALPPALLCQNRAGDHCRERIFSQARTFWCWVWQVLQANTSCREVAQQVRSLFDL